MNKTAKAYMYQNYEGELDIVFATSPGQAKSAVMYGDAWDEEPFIEIKVKRVPQLDNLQLPAGAHLDWSDMKQMKAVMNVLSIRCDGIEDVEEFCKYCECKDICDTYKDYLEDIEK